MSKVEKLHIHRKQIEGGDMMMCGATTAQNQNLRWLLNINSTGGDSQEGVCEACVKRLKVMRLEEPKTEKVFRPTRRVVRDFDDDKLIERKKNYRQEKHYGNAKKEQR